MTKYSRQIKAARRLIAAKGTTCTWYKTSAVKGDTTLPEFQGGTGSKTYPKVPIVFVPQDRLELATELGLPVLNIPSNQLFAYIPGDVGFNPEVDDKVLLSNGDTTTVSAINTLQPDLAPILFQVSFA